jgi:hypothetical protein
MPISNVFLVPRTAGPSGADGGILYEDGASFLMLEDGTSFALLE